MPYIKPLMTMMMKERKGSLINSRILLTELTGRLSELKITIPHPLHEAPDRVGNNEKESGKKCVLMSSPFICHFNWQV